jgi:signal-transduction protein with cAMP-binding, CBS, and nucleotidyltransferase domain
LTQQLRAVDAGAPVDHSVVLAELSTRERLHLKQAFVAIQRIQDGVRSAWRLDQLD